MRSSVHRKRLLRDDVQAVHGEQLFWIVGTCVPEEYVVGHDLPGSLPQAPHACIYSKLRNRNRTNGCSLFQPCNSPDIGRIGPRCTWSSGSGDRAGSWALHNDHIRFRALHGARLRQKSQRFHSAPPPQERSLPRRMAVREGQRSPV
jgi:hypothetical protein